MVMLVEKNIPIERTTKGEDHLCLSLVHHDRDGYYLYCYAVNTIKSPNFEHGQYMFFNKISSNGMKLLVRKASRKSTADEIKAIENAKEIENWLLAMVCNKYGLRRI